MRANQLRLWFASMAHVLRCALRRIGRAHTQFAEAPCSTIRLKLLKTGALVRVSVRRVKIAMASACPGKPSSGSPMPRCPGQRADTTQTEHSSPLPDNAAPAARTQLARISPGLPGQPAQSSARPLSIPRSRLRPNPCEKRGLASDRFCHRARPLPQPLPQGEGSYEAAGISPPPLAGATVWHGRARCARASWAFRRRTSCCLLDLLAQALG